MRAARLLDRAARPTGLTVPDGLTRRGEAAAQERQILRDGPRARPADRCCRPGRWAPTRGAGFTGVGGALHASLRRVHPRARVVAAFDAAGVPRGVVVGRVHPARWVTLVRALHPEMTAGRQKG